MVGTTSKMFRANPKLAEIQTNTLGVCWDKRGIGPELQ